MEVDLTDEDVVVTTQPNPSKPTSKQFSGLQTGPFQSKLPKSPASSASGSQKGPLPSASFSRLQKGPMQSYLPKSSASGSQKGPPQATHQKPSASFSGVQKGPSQVETVDITDDDDIIFEASVPSSKEKTTENVSGNASNEKRVNVSTPNNIVGSNSEKVDVIDADQVFEEIQRGKKKDSTEKAGQERPLVMETSKFRVIDITDEDDPINARKKKVDNNCLNVSCKSGENLTSAPIFVASYYGCKLKKGIHQVCAECFNVAMNHHMDLAGRLIAQKPLFSYKNFPVNDIPVVDLDSDEELSGDEDPLPYSMLKFADENLEEVIQEALDKSYLDFQIMEANEVLSDKMNQLELESKETDQKLKDLQKEIDNMRNLVYKEYEPIRKELESLDIPSCPPPCHIHVPMQQSRIRPQLIMTEERSPLRFGVATKRVTQMSPIRSLIPQQETSSEVVTVASIVPETSLPPIGALLRPKPRSGDVVYVMKMSFFGVWLRGRVMEVISETAAGTPMIQTVYKVKMEIQGNKKQFSIKTVPGRHMAYPNPSVVRLNVGTRVIAVFQDDESNNQNKGGSYYSGLIAEPPKSNNRFRYLVFFDDGYAQYVPHNKILVVCESSRNVWEDIHPDSREFIKKYLQQYPERPMVKLAANQVVKTEWNGKWWIARVVEVDGSLVKMSFDADGRTEWIYRGSTRLSPLYHELAQAQARLESGGTGTISRMRGMGVRRMNQPYVEYTRNIGGEDDLSEPAVPTPITTVRAVAKKSTSKKQETFTSQMPSSRISFFSPENVGIVQEMQLPKDAPMPKRYQAHKCNPQCINWIKYEPYSMIGYNPLSIPLYCGYQRELVKHRKKITIIYTSPCGRRLRNMEELHRYLRICKSIMSVDLFDFDYWVNALSKFAISDKVKKFIVQEDLSHGKENVKIPLVNYVDNSLPNNLIYATQREPFEDVSLNTDPEFLCGCDCTDDCKNKEKCACWQLTIQGSSLYPGGVPDPSVGYYYKRLQERVITGIYECNQQCKCSKNTCLNRVVQHPLQLQLQLFKTPNKGWGLRCINDIPKGTFICIYAGYLYTEQTANKIGEQDGDDYLAELDYIEVVERMKEDYESDVEDENMEEDEEESQDENDETVEKSRYKNKDDVDEEFKIGWRSSGSKSDASIRSRLRKRTAADMDSGDENKNGGDRGTKKREAAQRGDHDGDDDGSDDEKMERQPSSFTPKPLKAPGNKVEEPITRFQSVRKFYGPNERVYIMDANKVGNVGRYLNHSCSPNVFVQNVFVDTHDLRFPWVAFFALSYIKAGSELTWDYNYDIGSVPDKTIFCRCGSAECRGRLL